MYVNTYYSTFQYKTAATGTIFGITFFDRGLYGDLGAIWKKIKTGYYSR